MTGIGRASVPAIPALLPRRRPTASACKGEEVVVWQRPPQRDPWTARGLLWRLSCRRLLVPLLHPSGLRAYSCGRGCGHSDIRAEPAEQELLVKVLVRAAAASKHPELVSADETRRWRLTNPLDSHAMLRAGLVRADVGDAGELCPVWRHEVYREPAFGREALRW